MSELSIQFQDHLNQFVPGQKIQGMISWRLNDPATSFDLRIFWYTEGIGTQDVGIVWTTTFDRPALQGSHAFEFQLPNAPYTFSGKLISLIWAVELIVRPSNESTRAPFTMSPTGEEIELITQRNP